MKYSYDCTMRACFTGYIVQAIVNNFVPLLFLTFQRTYHIPLQQITLLVTFNFGIQLLTDLLSVAFVDPVTIKTLCPSCCKPFCKTAAWLAAAVFLWIKVSVKIAILICSPFLIFNFYYNIKEIASQFLPYKC